MISLIELLFRFIDSLSRLEGLSKVLMILDIEKWHRYERLEKEKSFENKNKILGLNLARTTTSISFIWIVTQNKIQCFWYSMVNLVLSITCSKSSTQHSSQDYYKNKVIQSKQFIQRINKSIKNTQQTLICVNINILLTIRNFTKLS